MPCEQAESSPGEQMIEAANELYRQGGWSKAATVHDILCAMAGC